MASPNVNRFALLVLLAASVLLVARLDADEPASPGAAHRVQKPINHPLARALVGTWKTKMSGGMTGSGTATFELGVGDTALLQDEQGTHHMEDGHEMKGFGHGVYRFSEDGRSVTAWWIDNSEPEMVKVAGSLTEGGFDVSGQGADGNRFRIVLAKTGTGFEVRSFMGDAAEPFWTQTYEKVSSN